MRNRFFKAAILSIVSGLVIAFLFAVPLMEQVYTDEAEHRLTAALALAAGYPVEGDDYAAMAGEVGRRMEQADLAVRLTVIAADGTVLGDSRAVPSAMDSHEDRPEVRDALASGTGRDIRDSGTLGGRQMYLAQAVAGPDGRTRIYRVSQPMDGLGRVRFTLWCCGGIGMFMGLVVALIAAHYAAGRVVEPLQELTKAARTMADGDEPVPVADAPGEMGELASAFNRMADRLAAAHHSLSQSNDQLAAVLQGMDDGVIAVSADGQITLMTRRAQELLGPCPPGEKRLDSCGVNYTYISERMEQSRAAKAPVQDVRSLAGTPERILHIYAAPISGGALAVLSDVTRLKKLETMRSEFVANVTHELKTPLTSIRGYIELLKDGPREEETARAFYEIIEIEAQRLQKLTDDLLQLSDIESAGMNEATPTPLGEIVENVTETLLPEANARGITLYRRIDPDLLVHAEARRLYQLMKNLMENAVKYNREGGSVNVSAGREHGQVIIRVQDTGIGIPAEHLERIFERFYRVDKGRSRELGGTGLGLSIVKHIVNLYGGTLQVMSEPGVGTTFTVCLD